jgi:hypothetical protein
VAKEASVAASGLNAGKKSFGNTNAAVVPYRKKS